jgi:cytochrome c55X
LRKAVMAVALMIPCGAAPAAESAPDPDKLSALVRQDCGSCHGLTLKGGLGKALTADALAPWNSEQLIRVILDGVPGTPMPPWRALLSEPEARWIANALKQGTVR